MIKYYIHKTNYLFLRLPPSITGEEGVPSALWWNKPGAGSAPFLCD